jgi:hypothetical protein
MMTIMFRTAMIRRLKFLFGLVTLLFPTAGTLFAACTATAQNHGDSPLTGFPSGPGSSSVSLTATVAAVGDLVVIAAYCFPINTFSGGCTPTAVTLGSQNATQTSVSMNPDPGTSGTPGSGQGRIYYILSAAASGSQTLSFSISDGNQQLQVSYIDFKPSAGCVFSHDIDSPLGANTAVSGTFTLPSFTPSAGDVLFNFTITSTHMVDPVGSPWSTLTWTNGSHFLENSIQLAAYDLSAPGGSVANDANTLHTGDSLQSLITSFSMSGQVTASGCPSGAPVSGNHCYFIAANGADTNSGTDESHPWLHAPGMPNCAATCLTVSNSLSGSATAGAGMGFIFRGGDTWHFGNSALTPYTGGTWNINVGGNPTTCLDERTSSGCAYFGVDPGWYSGSSWSRPILNGDNPTTGFGTTKFAASCAFQDGASNTLVATGGNRTNIYLDNFELAGLCSKDTTGGATSSDTYIAIGGTGSYGLGMIVEANLYVHGWSVTSNAGSSNNAIPCNILGGGTNGLQTITHIVVDGSDSNPSVCAWGGFPSFYHFKDSIIRYVTQGVGQWCHDIHDNVLEHFYNPFVPTHGNILECNSNSPGNAPNQPANTPNVVYNNIIRHDDPSFGPAGQVHLWLCPQAVPEYWFNNLEYDVAGGNFWDIAGPPGYSCPNTGGQFMFNNTLVDIVQPCHLTGSNQTGGQYLTVMNEHLINTPYDGTGCKGAASSATNVSMSSATAASQGYTTGSGGASGSANTCANDPSTPCTPTLPTNSTVSIGANQMAYCNALASFTSESAISTDAANACKYGTTDACSYNTTTHTMNCPGHTPVARPTTLAWDSGASQFSATQAQLPQPPTSLLATVN